MYTIKGVLATKIAPEGIIRMETSFVKLLNSAIGVERYLEEQKPFRELTVTYLNEDVTSKFIKK